MAIVLHHSAAKGGAKIILLGIANHTGEHGAWPSVETLSKYANVDVRSVHRYLSALEDSGELVIHSHGGVMAGRGKTNLYEIVLGCPPDCDGTFNHRQNNNMTNFANNMTNLVEQHDNVVIQTIKNRKEPNTLRGTRLDENNFVVTEEMREWANTRFPDVNVDIATESFIDYWTSKATGATKTDWVKTWRNWIRRERPTRQTSNQPKMTNLQRNLDLVRRMATNEREIEQ